MNKQIITPQLLGALALCGLAFSAANSSHAAPVGWKSSDFAKWSSPVSPDAIVIEGKTDILWKPQPFAFKAGATVRYIDFDGGSDTNDGSSKTSAWKHHPWDKNATGKAAAMKGVATYVFKGGTIYRGALVGKESGSAAEPIRLTRDPSWGTGAATIAGSEAIGGWTKLTPAQAKLAGVPDEAGGHIWAADVAGQFVPRATWILKPDGTRERMTLARWPNWKITDPYNHFTEWLRVEKIDKGFPLTTIYAPKVLNDPDPNAYKGATIWADHAVTSGEFSIMGPFPSSVGKYDPVKGSLQPELIHPVRHPAPNSPFFLENLPRFLDEAGEWYYDSKARRMLVWMKGDADPNKATIEAARQEILVDLVGVKNVEVSGLRLTGGNTIDLNTAPDVGGYEKPTRNTLMCAVRMVGNCQDITLKNLEIRDTAGAGITNYINGADDVVRGIRILDNRMADLDNDAIMLNRGALWRKGDANPKGRLTELEIYRNHITNVGFRGSVEQAGRGIDLIGPEVADIAGNVIQRITSHGININGGRPMGGFMSIAPETPLVRIQVRQNKVEEAIMYKSDFGNIEFWATGPVYVYGNLSLTPVGIVPAKGQFHKNHAFYFDHGFKGYIFNNIGWSAERAGSAKGVMGDQFMQEIRNRWNMTFQNTAYDFRRFANHESRHGDQQFYLGNLAINMRGSFLSFSRLKEAEGIGLAGNVVAGDYDNFYQRYRGEEFKGIEGLRTFLGDADNYVAKEIGVATDDSPVVNAEKHDFRPTNTSAAIDRGTNVFVPWSLSGTVGEWYFRMEPKNPNIAWGHDLYPQKFYNDNDMIHIGGALPGNDLKGEGFTTADYSEGALENWNQGAVRFDGKKTFKLANATLVKDFEIGDKNKKTIVGKDRKTVRMEANNFIVESVFRAEPNAKGGFIAAKLSAVAGYGLGLDNAGNLQMLLRAGGKDFVQKSTASVADGVWHHALAEVDRANGKITIYLDGKVVGSGASGLAATVSLDNAADFVVGEGFRGQLDFLRVSRGTLADAMTNINELMSWQFNGPASHDFAGRPAFGNGRDSGALENTTARGLQTVNYTPRTTAAAPTRVAANTGAGAEEDEFKKGPDRTVKSLEWGAVSVPKTIKPGEELDVQVALVTETVERSGFFLKVDLHGSVKGKRVAGMGASARVALTPGKTTPYTLGTTIPTRDGLDKVWAIVYISTNGKWDTKTIATEVSVDVSDKAPAATTKMAAKTPDKAPAKMAGGAGDKIKEGDDRTVKTADWGKVSAPKEVNAGEEVEVQIAFAPDAIKSDTVVRFDLHGFVNGKRVTGLGRSAKFSVKAGDTSPLEMGSTVPTRSGLAKVVAVIYVSPDGSWAKKTISSEISVDVK